MSGRQVVSIRLFEESPEYVIAVGVKQEQQEESHAHVLGCHEYVFGYFASGDHFPQQEHDVTAVEKATWPPSKAGIGIMFMNASATDRNAVISQNESQFQRSGNIFPIVPNPPRLCAPSDEKTCFIEPT